MKNIITLCLLVFSVTVCKSQIDEFKYRKKEVTIEEIQQAIEYNLSQVKFLEPKFYRIPYPPYVESFFYKYEYFSEKAKQRMVELFEGKWTEEEVKARINSGMERLL